MFPLSVFIIMGFNLSCSNNPRSNFPSNVLNKWLCGSTIFYMTNGPTYLIATFLEVVLNWLVKGDIMYTKSPLLYWKTLYPYWLVLNVSLQNFAIIFIGTVISCSTMWNTPYRYLIPLCPGWFLSLIISWVFSQILTHMVSDYTSWESWRYYMQK